MVERIQRGSETLSYISSPDGLVAMHISDDGDEMKYVLTDYLGTIYALVDDGAQSTEDALYYSFNAWGERRELQAYDGSLTAPLFSDPADYITSRGYTGHEHIDAFDLINMNGRVYDPNTSSFLSPDPVMQSPDNPQNLNRYSYCLNNPTKYIDPSGFTQQKPPRLEWLENNYGFEGGSYFYRGQQFYYDSEKGGFNGNMGGYHSGNNASGYSTAGIHSNESSSTGYINRYGEEVPFDYVYDHVIEPNSDNYYGADALNQLRDIAQNSMTMDFPSDFYSSNVSMNGKIYMVTSKNPIGNYRIKYGGIIFPRGCSTHIVGPVIIGSAGGGELQLNSTASYIYDGQFRSDPLIHSMEAGQHVRVEVKNMNILGVQLDLQDKSRYAYEKNWLGIESKVYTGDSHSMVLLPGQSRSFDFYMFNYVPMNWQFELSTKISGAANVQIRFYSDWVPGMPYDPNHPNR